MTVALRLPTPRVRVRSLLSGLCREGEHEPCNGFRRVSRRSQIDWRECHCPCHRAKRR